jgi:hypothetical protein
MKRLFRRPGADASFAYWRKMERRPHFFFVVLARVQVLHFHDLMHTQSMERHTRWHVFSCCETARGRLYVFDAAMANRDQSEQMTAKIGSCIVLFCETG